MLNILWMTVFATPSPVLRIFAQRKYTTICCVQSIGPESTQSAMRPVPRAKSQHIVARARAADLYFQSSTLCHIWMFHIFHLRTLNSKYNDLLGVRLTGVDRPTEARNSSR